VKVLAFDTALGACSAAVLDGDRVLAHQFRLQIRGHAETVMQMVAQVCKDADLGVADFDRLGVTVGPGTFTGQRVGLAAARAMVLGTSVDLVGITTLEAVASAVKIPHTDDLIISVFDARRGEVYFQAFGKRLDPLSEPAADTPERAVQRLLDVGRNFILVGSGCALISDLLTKADAHVELAEAAPQPDARFVARLAARARKTGTALPSPLYLRAPDAKLPMPKEP
jgi:tRNA threonylcarbamoyl adenosine modification protein YeaZ